MAAPKAFRSWQDRRGTLRVFKGDERRCGEAHVGRKKVHWGRSGPIALLLLVVGCGESHESAYSKFRKETEAEYEAMSPAEKRAATRASRAQGRREERQRASRRRQREGPGGAPPGDWTSEEKQPYETNRLLCASEPSEQLASEWEVHNDAGSIAHAIGLEYRNRQDMQVAAEEGCLAALIGG